MGFALGQGRRLAAAGVALAVVLPLAACGASAPAGQPIDEPVVTAASVPETSAPSTAAPAETSAPTIEPTSPPATEGSAPGATGASAAGPVTGGGLASGTPQPRLGEWRGGRGVAGIDVSSYQPEVPWEALVRSGNGFVYIKATEGTTYRSPTHDEQRTEARAAGLVQGAYHYARPAASSGTMQARFFQGHGGSWSADEQTLPGALDLELAASGDACHGLTPSAMRAWIREFSDEYRRLSGRIPVIYTSSEFWDTCTAGDTTFADHPLWLFDHGDLPDDLPRGWERPTLWQSGVVDGLDRNVFFGSPEQLTAWAVAPLR